MINFEEMQSRITEFEASSYKDRLIMIITNNNLASRILSVSPIKSQKDLAILTIVIYEPNHIYQLLGFNYGKVTGFLLDAEEKNGLNIYEMLSEKITRYRLFPIYPSNLVRIASEKIVDVMYKKSKENRALIFGLGNISRRIAIALLERNFFVDFISRRSQSEFKSEQRRIIASFPTSNWRILREYDPYSEYDFVFTCFPGIRVTELDSLKSQLKDAIHVDVGGNAYSSEFIRFYRDLGNPPIHLSIDNSLLAWVGELLIADKRVKALESTKRHCGHNYVVIGQPLLNGEVCVDQLPNPSKLFGQYSSDGSFHDFNCECRVQQNI